jgi:hypothetical protein
VKNTVISVPAQCVEQRILDLRHVSGKLEVLHTCLPVVGHLSCMSKERDAFRILVWYSLGNHLLENLEVSGRLLKLV